MPELNGGDDEIEDFGFDGQEGLEDGGELGTDGDETAGQEGADQNDEADDAQGQVGQPQGQSRRDRRIESLTQRSQQKDAELAELRRQMNDILTRASAPPQPTGPDPVLERMRFEAMTPEERSAYMLQQGQEAQARQQRAFELRMMDQTDRLGFETRCAQDARIAKFKDRVETLHMQEMQKGNFLNRDTICKYLIGEAVLAKKPGAVSRQQRQAQQAIQRQQVRPSDGRSDVGQGGRRGKTAAERLQDVTF